MEDEAPAEESVGLDLDNKDHEDRTITITGLSLEDAAKIILQEQETPGHYQILTQDIPDVPESDGQACVTVVQEVTNDDMGVFEGNLEQTGETMYITPDMINSGTIQMSDGSLYLTQDIEEQSEERGDYNTIYITPGELESAQRQTCQSAPIEEESNIMKTENSEVKVEQNCDLVAESSKEKSDLETCKTLHVNVINMGEDVPTDEQASHDSIINQNVASIVEDSSDITNVKENINEETENQVITEKYVVEAVKQEPLVTEDVKTIDLSKPIAVTDTTEIIIKGKKCVLMPNPDTGQLCAYPVVPPQSKKRRGRPKKPTDQDYLPPAGQNEEGVKGKPVKRVVNKIDQANAVEGLLELSNTGPDGIRRSGRARKKKALEDYELIEDSDEENHDQNQSSVTDEQDYVPPSYTFASPSTGSKRGRGRPRRYPPPGQASTSSIPAVLIPGANGQTLMMAPIQGLQNFQAFQEQVKSLPSLLTKTSQGVTTINAQIISTSNGQIISTTAGQIVTSAEGQIISTSDGQIISTSGGQILSTGEGSLMSTSEGQILSTGEGSLVSTNEGQIISTGEGQLISTSEGQIVSCDNGSIITHSVQQSVISGEDNYLIETGTIDSENANETGTEDAIPEESSTSPPGEEDDEGMEISDELENDDVNEDTDDLGEVAVSAQAMVSSIINPEGSSEGLKPEVGTTSEGQTILQIPEDLLPIFMPKKDPIKLGLKASERELEKLKCPKCDFQAFYLQQYQSHIAIHSDDVQKCKCCHFVSFDRDSLLQHFKDTHPRCICTICDFMAEHAYVIKRHMMRHTGDGCTCELCGKTYKDQYILKMHVKMVHMPADVLFECTICYKKFTRKAHLKRHLRIHEAEKPYKCPHCEYRGCERSDISKHLLIHEEPKHVCKVCGKAFRHIKNKELHLKRHNGQKDYKCGVCDFYGYTFTDIRKHIERRHADIKTLVCDKCGSAFKTEALLREHQKQQCEVFMIEQGFSIATSNGGTSQATIQIPSSLSAEGQQITIDGQQITVEQVIPEEDISLTEDELRESLQNGTISEAQVIEACQVEMGDEEEQSVIHMEGDIDDGLSMSLT